MSEDLVTTTRKGDVIGYVVRDVTGETQLSIRFVLRSHARTFAEQCAMPVRIWRVVPVRKAAVAINTAPPLRPSK